MIFWGNLKLYFHGFNYTRRERLAVLSHVPVRTWLKISRPSCVWREIIRLSPSSGFFWVRTTQVKKNYEKFTCNIYTINSHTFISNIAKLYVLLDSLYQESACLSASGDYFIKAVSVHIISLGCNISEKMLTFWLKFEIFNYL